MIQIRNTNRKRLASLSALGAGAIGLSAGTAQASSIIYSGILDERLYIRSALAFSGPNGAGGVLTLTAFAHTSSRTFGSAFLKAHKGSKSTRFAFLDGSRARPWKNYVLGLPLSDKWSTAKVNRETLTEGLVAGHRATQNGKQAHFTAFNVTNRYLLFEFTGGNLPETLYGWAQLDVYVTNIIDPEVTLVDWAYDTSGAQIPAGDTGAPEPTTFALTSLAALALGAKGLRSWRAARKVA